MKSARVVRPALHLVPSTELDLDDLYRRYCRYVATIALRLHGQRGELEDVIQDVFAEAAAGLARVREPEAVRGWLATITVRVVRRRLRRLRLQRFFGLAPGVDYEQVADGAASPFDRILILRIYATLDTLPVDDRLAFVLHHMEGETIEHVAVLCGCSRTTAKRRIFRARTRLEETLSDV